MVYTLNLYRSLILQLYDRSFLYKIQQRSNFYNNFFSAAGLYMEYKIAIPNPKSDNDSNVRILLNNPLRPRNSLPKNNKK